MAEERPFDAKAPLIDQRRKEKVYLDTGFLWVWEMNAADTLFIVERSLRPSQGKGPELATGDAMLWRVLVSCHKGDAPDSERTFDLADLPRIQLLRKSEWDRLLEAIERVNGLDEAEVPALKDFTPAVSGNRRRS